ncbi:MEDS domain-containing protein [uncultured Streptomyces sp.]|uniref:MEDS domain-containing protein n=1 Tax=uncultured Streptomyces sp. TaxID=174707 RepID=UPI002639C705|nr:MEDS domain-containing protein [uncultured Streptomyces sp.]
MPPAPGSLEGRHTSVVFSDDRQWAGHLVAFVRGGLEKGERVRYFAGTTAPEQVLRALTGAGVDAAGAVTRGQLSVSVAAQSCLAGPGSDPDAMIGSWFDEAEAARAAGYPALRAISEMSWRAGDVVGADRLLEYELRLHHEVFDRLPLTAWCFYDRRLMSDAYVNALAGAHVTQRGEPCAGPALRVAPSVDRPGLALSGSAGYDTRDAVAAAAAVVSSVAAAQPLELDLAALRHVDAASLAALADAAAARPGGTRLKVRQAPSSLRRLLQLFPEFDSVVEVVDR